MSGRLRDSYIVTSPLLPVFTSNTDKKATLYSLSARNLSVKDNVPPLGKGYFLAFFFKLDILCLSCISGTMRGFCEHVLARQINSEWLPFQSALIECFSYFD